MLPPFPTLWTQPRDLARRIRAFVVPEQRLPIAERMLLRRRRVRPIQPSLLEDPDESWTSFVSMQRSLQKAAHCLQLVPGRAELQTIVPEVLAAYDDPPAQNVFSEFVCDWPDDVSLEDVLEGLASGPNAEATQRLIDRIQQLRETDWKTVTSWAGMIGMYSIKNDAHEIRSLGASAFEWLDVWMHASLVAHAIRASRLIGQDLNRPFIAVDAGNVHHAMLSRVRDLPKRGKYDALTVGSVAEILVPDKQLAMFLDIRDLPSQIIDAIRKWRSWHGLRHWAGILRLLTVAGRSGKFIWRLDDHLDALGYEERSRRDPVLRQQVTDEVRALTLMEFAVYNANGDLRIRKPVLTVETVAERKRLGDWKIEGMEIEIHPWLYSGVRKANGDLGSLWAPAPTGLAQINHAHYPHAIALGLVLSIRWRWDVNLEINSITLTGEKLLKLAGIEFDNRHAGRFWRTLELNLEELQRIGGIEAFEWFEGEAWSLEGRCRLLQPQWVRERMVHSLKPQRSLPGPVILTGNDLLAWRKERRMTQQQLANELGQDRRTIIRAEKSAAAALSTALKRAIDQRVIEIYFTGSGSPKLDATDGPLPDPDASLPDPPALLPDL